MDRFPRFSLLGVGAMNSPRFRPAGLLVRHGPDRVMLDGGGDAVPPDRVGAWLVTDDRAELMPDIRRRCRSLDLEPAVAPFRTAGISIEPVPVVHTSHPAYGYRIEAGGTRTVWAPEFWEFPDWADGADLLFADAAGWRRPIRFARGVGGHAAVLDTAEQARRRRVRRLVFAHIGRPSIRAIDGGAVPPYGEWGVEGRTYRP
ncbi:MBL fold metallo-hydrolase [Actinomadura sp. K4S16]|uniref:MBL fold metallo-hydrolase n=1 Tax=Actinomadura sp. K4S16 TaxID=1316147 RepID=UPI00190F6D1C|nr:MBL fold metallo-hydrolase [Actinomadura sp. K4S16]